MTRPMNDPAMAATWLTPEGEAALVGGEGVGEDRAGVGHQHGAADALETRIAISHRAPALPVIQVTESSTENR